MHRPLQAVLGRQSETSAGQAVKIGRALQLCITSFKEKWICGSVLYVLTE